MKLACVVASSALMFATAAAAAPGVQVVRPWSRPAPAGATGAGYLTLVNRGAKPDALVAVSSPLASGAMIHRSAVSSGVASMQHVDHVELAPGASVTFAPGGYHVMFMGLKKPLVTGDALPATLTFASGARMNVAFAVRVTPPPGK
jgi:copper(I)-binding protein